MGSAAIQSADLKSFVRGGWGSAGQLQGSAVSGLSSTFLPWNHTGLATTQPPAFLEYMCELAYFVCACRNAIVI